MPSRGVAFRRAVLALGVLALACTSPRDRLKQAVDSGDFDRAREIAVSESENNPDGDFVHYDMAWVYANLANRELRTGNQRAFIDNFGRAQNEYLLLLRQGARNEWPHRGLGSLLTLAQDLDGALQEFRIACSLSPYAQCYAELTELHVYREEFGMAAEARRGMDGRLESLQKPELFRHADILLPWKRGDLAAAQRAFDASIQDPGFAREFDGVTLDEPMRQFADFTKRCCHRVVCATGMHKACVKAGHDGGEVTLTARTRAALAGIALTRSRTLRKLYAGNPEILFFLPKR